MVARLSGSAGAPGVGFYAGKTGTISLKEIYATGSTGPQGLDGSTGYYGYDRIFTAAADDYKRVNPFEVEDGNAPDPALFPPSPISYSLAPWNGYTQWDSGDRAKSIDFDLTAFDYDSATFTWTRATGYTRNPESLTQYLYVDNCTPVGDCDATTSDCCGVNLGDETSKEVSLSPGTTYAATIVTLWDELGTGFSKRESDIAALKSTLTLGAPDTFSQIYFTTTACPNCTQMGSTNVRLTNTDPMGICTGGTSTIFNNGAATTIGALNGSETLFTVKSGSPCSVCSSAVTQDWAEDSNHYVELSGGTIVSGPTVCGGICLHYDMVVRILKMKNEKLINVYDVKVGDLIKTETGYTKVVEVMVDHIREGYYIIEGGLKITNDHPFIYNDEWITPEEYPGKKVYVSGNVPTVYIGTEDEGFMTYGDKNQWLVSGTYKKCD